MKTRASVLGVLILVTSALGCGSAPPPADPTTLQFRLVPHESPPSLGNGRCLAGWIEVSRSDTKEVVQTIPVELSDPVPEWRAYGVQRADIDFDGYDDVGILEHGGSKWGYLHWWIYDGSTGQFVWTSLSDELYRLTPANYRLDATKRQLEVKNFMGARLETSRYEVRDGHLHEVETPNE